MGVVLVAIKQSPSRVSFDQGQRNRLREIERQRASYGWQSD